MTKKRVSHARRQAKDIPSKTTAILSPNPPPNKKLSDPDPDPADSLTEGLSHGEDELSLQLEDIDALVEPGQKFLNTDRTRWNNEADSLVSLIVFAVDFARVSRFTFNMFKYGGIVFLLPYFITLVLINFPVLYMELIVGQFVQEGYISVWKIVPLFKGVGFAFHIILTVTEMYYATAGAWAALFLAASLNVTSSEAVWAKCDNRWNSEACVEVRQENLHHFDRNSYINQSLAVVEFFKGRVLRLYESKYVNHEALPVASIDSVPKYGFNEQGLGTVNLDLAMIILVYFLLILFFNIVGAKLCAKVVWVTSTTMYVFLSIVFFRGITLPGALTGLAALFKPNFASLLKLETWGFASLQAFYSSSAAFGVHLATACHNNFHHNVFRDSVVLTLFYMFTNIMMAILIFSYVGNVAHMRRLGVVDTIAMGNVAFEISGIELFFEEFCESIQTVPGYHVYAILFYAAIMLATFDSSMVGMLSYGTSVYDEFGSRIKARLYPLHLLFVASCVTTYLGSLIFLTKGGVWAYIFVEAYGTSACVIVLVFVETVAVSWIWGMEELCDAAEAMTGRRPGLYLRLCWKFFTPISLFVLIALGFWNLLLNRIQYAGMIAPVQVTYTGIAFSVLPLLCIPFYAIFKLCSLTNVSGIKQRFIASITPTYELNGTLKKTQGKQKGSLSQVFKGTFSSQPKFGRVGSATSDSSIYELMKKGKLSSSRTSVDSRVLKLQLVVTPADEESMASNKSAQNKPKPHSKSTKIYPGLTKQAPVQKESISKAERDNLLESRVSDAKLVVQDIHSSKKKSSNLKQKQSVQEHPRDLLQTRRITENLEKSTFRKSSTLKSESQISPDSSDREIPRSNPHERLETPKVMTKSTNVSNPQAKSHHKKTGPR